MQKMHTVIIPFVIPAKAGIQIIKKEKIWILVIITLFFSVISIKAGIQVLLGNIKRGSGSPLSRG